jgi:3-isopropylmalate/(R)-2-methylmalate dehydratase small subunit
VTLPEAEVQVLTRRAEAASDYVVTVDLVQRQVYDRQGFAAGFPFDEYRREMLLQGLDEIGKTLLEEPRIAAFERRRAALAAGDVG